MNRQIFELFMGVGLLSFVGLVMLYMVVFVQPVGARLALNEKQRLGNC